MDMEFNVDEEEMPKIGNCDVKTIYMLQWLIAIIFDSWIVRVVITWHMIEDCFDP